MKTTFNSYETLYKLGIFLSTATQALPTLYNLFSKTQPPLTHEESIFKTPSYLSTGIYFLGTLCLLKACSSILSSCAEDVKKIFSKTTIEKSNNPIIFNMVFSGATSNAIPIQTQSLNENVKKTIEKIEESLNKIPINRS